METSGTDIVQVDELLKDLIPGFMHNRRQEIPMLETIRESNDFDAMAKYGHQLKGVALNYGFQKLGEAGIQIEEAAKQKDIRSFESAIQTIRAHLDSVKVEFI